MDRLETILVFSPNLDLTFNLRSETPKLSTASIGSLAAALQLGQRVIFAVGADGSFENGNDPQFLQQALKASRFIETKTAGGILQQVYLVRTPQILAGCVAGQVLSQLIKNYNPDLVLLPSSTLANEAAAYAAVKADSGVITNVQDLQVTADGTVEISKEVLNGKWHTTSALTRGVPLVTLSNKVTVNGVNVESVKMTDSAVESGLTVNDDSHLPTAHWGSVEILELETESLVRVENYQVQCSEGISLNDAAVVVCAGRGIDGQIAPVQELADLLQGAVGATRVVCDEGWLPRSAQIGQTGAVINPDLYIGLGVSGQIHHTCGMQGSRQIVAVVDDPDAPLVEMADLAIIGDLEEILPDALEILRTKKNS